MKTVDEKCGSCGSIVQVLKKEWTRQRGKNPDRVFYCGLNCAAKTRKNIEHLNRVRTGDNAAATAASRLATTKYSIFEKPFAEIMRRVRNRVREKSRFKKDFDVDLQYLMSLWDKQDAKCALTGIPLSFNTPNKLLYPSLDRKDCNIGYTKGNVQFTCTAANLGKGACSDAEFKEFLEIAVDQLN